MKILILLFLLIPASYILTAIHSVGYYYPDEHYQIVEFAGLKGGWNAGADLPWEYDAQIRPALQPMMALSVFKILNILGINNPFQLSLCLRMLTAVFAFFCIGCFVRSFLPFVRESNRTAFIMLSFLLWFLPAVNVRFSSETWAGLTLLLSIALLHSTGKRNFFTYAGIGVLWGLCFEFRYQMAIPLFGLFLWLIIIRKEKISRLLFLLSGSLAVVACCFLLDSWYYEHWVFAPGNYFKSNIVDNVASHYGVSPWYFYLEETLNRPTPLIGLFILAALIIFFARYYKNMIVWCIIPYLLIHSLIPHKELRFLFPMVYFLPFILVLAYQEISEKCGNQVKKVILYPLLILAAIINTGGLLMLSFKPAFNGNIAMLQYIQKHFDQVELYTATGTNPYTLNSNIKGLTPNFYKNDKVKVKNFTEIGKLCTQEPQHVEELVVLPANFDAREYLDKLGFKEEWRSIPEWVERMDRFYKVYKDYDYVFVLYSKKMNGHDKTN